ncbi:hypothetical protein SAMN02949497_2310 [Methylomagnum ishizawai]|uniref:Uncharacterized protein n=1 Tax=Methylomagnum ishizawai TaxID=1760988 RepID=A0A1Y6CX85_9GAMM|nr:hypothetical protein [Methylomagnum ishizawai]SMF94971.1 hypothetical protein SAMN02949497_2310 [Methylomagnum ishizawai]
MFPITRSRRARGGLLVLALLLCHLAYGGQVRSLFNPNNFIAEDGALLTEQFWSTPDNKLYGKAMTEWEDADFSELETELRRAVYVLSLSQNPYRHVQVDRLQRAVDLVPSFKLWVRHAKEGAAPVEGERKFAKDKPAAQAEPKFAGLKGKALAWIEAALPVWLVKSYYWQRLGFYSGKYILPYLLPTFIVSVSASVSGMVWYHLYRRLNVFYCPKCKTRDRAKLRVGTRTFKSIFRRGKRKCYCSVCNYKWIQR